MSRTDQDRTIDRPSRIRRAVITALWVLPAVLLALIILHSVIQPPEVIKCGDLWVRRDARLDFGSEYSSEFFLRIGRLGWWPVYGNQGAHDDIELRHGVYMRSYSRIFAVSPDDIPEPSTGWPEVVRTDRR